MQKIISFITALSMLFSTFTAFFSGKSFYRYTIDTDILGSTVPNIVDNVNVWNMGTQFYEPQKNERYDIMEFVDYIQLMQCSGGTEDRDLFLDPLNNKTLTDFDFSRLIKNCHGIISLGAKPHLKLGGVPLKFTSDHVLGGFEMNPYPPDDYEIYYNYIKALVESLVDEFGKEEVLKWRFGCMTEFENDDWFYSKDKTPEGSMTAYFKLYDYTVKALTDVLGDDVFVGAHCMGVTEGLWDEREFLKHCAVGTNYATGEKGTKIKFFSASFYDSRPGKYTKGFTLPKLYEHLKDAADQYGLNDLIFGIDEGRILFGMNKGTEDDALITRITGYTWQAAYDARLFTQAIKSGFDYFSSWGFLSGGLFSGYPSVSYHVANNLYKFADGRQAKVTAKHINSGFGIESDCLTSWNDDTKTLRIMTYNFKNNLKYNKSMDIELNISVPQLSSKQVTVTKYVISDDCNYFDEWVEDRKIYNIGNDKFFWSPDDPAIESTSTLSDKDARDFYFENLRDKYEQCSVLTPITETAEVENGKIVIKDTLEAGNVIFYEIN